MRRWLLVATVLASACTAPTGSEAPTAGLPAPPAVPSGPLDDVTVESLEHRFWLVGRPRPGDMDRIVAARDVRVAWPLVDLLRFEQGGPDGDVVEQALATLTGLEEPRYREVAAQLGADPDRAWVVYTELLLAWDVPAPPDYLRFKAAQHRMFDQRWDPFFDPGSDLDWRQVSWGGVPRDGIPDLRDPEPVPAGGATSLEPDDIVFGVELEGVARAYPRDILEVHEVVNDELAGVPVVLSFCTLCGVATAYRATLRGPGADAVDGPLELGTSGLLFRSNKLMHDRATESLFEQFSGRAVTGPLHRAGARLERLPLEVVTWQDWRRAHPTTTVVAVPEGEDPEKYDGTFLDGRPADTPAFPTGTKDERLPPRTVVFGVDAPDGARAFPVEAVEETLAAGGAVELAGVTVAVVDGGLVARDASGAELASRQAFWFAWSQFRPGTLLWSPAG